MNQVRARSVFPLVNLSASGMEPRYQGVPYGRPKATFDASGPVRPWFLLKDVIEGTRRHCFHKFAGQIYKELSYLKLAKLTASNVQPVPLVRRQHHDFEATFWEHQHADRLLKESINTNKVLVATSSLAGVHKQHLFMKHNIDINVYSSEQEAYNTKYDKTIKPTKVIPSVVSSLSNYTFIDPKAHKPVDVVSHYGFDATGLETIEPVSVRVPKTAGFEEPVYVVERTVAASDLDENLHVNQSNYLKWAMDAYAEYKNAEFAKTAGGSGKRKMFDPLLMWPITEIDMQHMQEAFAFEKFNISVYQDTSVADGVAYFEFRNAKKPERPAFIAKIVFNE